MNIGKLKNLMILFLAVLNAALLALNIAESRKYLLSVRQETAIRSLLSQNGIGLHKPPIKDFSPKSNLSVTVLSVPEDELLRIFFEGGEDPVRTVENNETAFNFGGKNLYVNHGYVFYEDLDAGRLGYYNMTADEKMELCEAYAVEIGKLHKSMNFELDRTYEDEDEYVIEFRGEADGYVVYSNFIRFHFFDEDVFQIDFSFAEVNGFAREKKDIFAADEILLTLMYELKNIYGDYPVEILDMDIVYRLMNSGGLGEAQNATPYYRVYIKEQPEPFLIDAYLNRLS